MGAGEAVARRRGARPPLGGNLRPRARRREGQGLFKHVRPERVGRRKAMAMMRPPPLSFQQFYAH